MPDRKKFTVDPARASRGEPVGTSGICVPGGNYAVANTEGNGDMNMMSKIAEAPLTETGFGNILIRQDDPAGKMWDAATAPVGTPEGLVVGARLPMIPLGTSPALAKLIKSWRDAYRVSEAARTDDELTAAGDLIRESVEAIRTCDAQSTADVAAKLGISAFTLNGAGVVGLSGISNDNQLYIRDEYALDVQAEDMLVAAAKDAERIGGLTVQDSAWNALLAEYRLALGAERSHFALHIGPVTDHLDPGPELNAAVDGVTADIWAEDERLSNIRYEIEDRLMAHPAPDAAAFAEKFLIAYGDGRDANGWNDVLETEAQRFASSVIHVTEPATASAPARGTHPICEDDREVFVGLPDLRTGRSLEDALAHLDRIAAIDPSAYPEEWREEIRDVGGSASANYPKDGKRHLYVGQPCDAQEGERRRRVDALYEHMHAIDGMYDRVGDFLERRGHCTDNRPRNMRETTAALRDFIAAGFLLFLYPDGRLGSSGGMPKDWVQARPARAAEIEDAARRFGRVRRRWRNEPQIKRAIRLLGTFESNGFIVLGRKEG